MEDWLVPQAGRQVKVYPAVASGSPLNQEV